jgi:nucleotide-binding universal stress UspA family protein
MFRNVLVGVDGTQGGRDAIALAQQVAGPEATLMLAHVCFPFPGRGATEAVPIERAQAQQLLERERRLAQVRAQLVVGDPWPVGSGLHLLAEQRGADLIVVGSTRRALVGRVLLGDDCLAALDGAPCAVGIAPRGHVRDPHPLQRLGVGFDGSSQSEAALAAARELAAAHAGTIKAFWVISPREVHDTRLPADWPDALDRNIDRRADCLAQLEGVHGVVTSGDPGQELAQAGKQLDLLIVGSRGYGPIGRLIHGSVSRYLAGHATCPLLVLARQADLPRGAAGDTQAAIASGE